MAHPRILLAGGVALTPVVVGIVLATSGTDGSDRTRPARPAAGEAPVQRPVRTVRAKLTLERAEVQPDYDELLVSLPDERLNSLETSGGATSVSLTCVGREGEISVRQRHPWPLVVEEGYPPHIHQPARPDTLAGLRRCRLTGPGIDFVGRVGRRLARSEPPG